MTLSNLTTRLHNRLGDLWWYSLMIFIACRSGDVIQAFIGLWLVPKYVGPKELGAVLPLQQLSTLFAVPLAIIATVFAKYVNTYATRGEFGKVKCFIRDVLLASAVIFIFCIAAAYLLIPHFYVRLNVASGMLTILILASGFATNISSLFSAALQGLKKFRTMTIQNLLSAPIRLVTLLIAMPIRALSGYILGQTTPPATCSLLAAYSLHKDLKPHPLDPTWRRDLPEIWRYLWPIAVNLSISTLCGTICYTVYRQRLCPIESSAFYLITRFAEITSYIGAAISVVMFPLASEAHENGKDPQKFVIKSSMLLGIAVLAMTLGCWLIHNQLFSISPTWSAYKDYSYLLPVIAFYSGCAVIVTNFITYEMACRRFGAMFLVLLTTVGWNLFLITFTGAEVFRGILPEQVVNWMVSVHLARLDLLSYLAVPFLLFQLLITIIIFSRNARRQRNRTCT